MHRTRTTSPSIRAALAAAAALAISGCLSFDEDGSLYYDPPSLNRDQPLLTDIQNRMANHDSAAVREFTMRQMIALHGNDPEKLAELQAGVNILREKAPFIPGVEEYKSWIDARMAYFDAAEAARKRTQEIMAMRNSAPASTTPTITAQVDNHIRQVEADKRRKDLGISDDWVERDGIFYPAPKPQSPSFDVASLPKLPEEYRNRSKSATAPKTAAAPTRPVDKHASDEVFSAIVRDRKYWSDAVKKRDRPKASDELVPRIRRIFANAGLPPELVWIAEVESTMDAKAKSPAGAAGLFQLMPKTATSLGLKLRPTDQRLDPEHNARAAAKYLRQLYGRFGSWPLALAAYNAGQGRVDSLCKKHKSKSFDVIAPGLPEETQMYVPRVLETIRLRTGVNPDRLPPPS